MRAAVVRTVVALAALGALAVAVSGRRFLVGEVAMLEAANGLPSAVGWPLRVAMELGTLWAGIVLTVAVALCTRRAPVASATAVLVATLVAFRLDNVLKDVIDRPRPPGLVSGLEVRETISGYGFPSGHSTMAFALAAAVHPTVPPRLRWVPWVLAAAVGLARMHVGVHWPADVVGGAALGTAVGSGGGLLARAPGRRAGSGAGVP
jgi:undecaprenyl-diphosphatase